MGNALVVMTVSEELLEKSPLCIRGDDGRAMAIEKTTEAASRVAHRERVIREHPDAFWLLRVPYGMVWRPPEEPWRQSGLNWHWDPDLLVAHRASVVKSLEEFLNGKLSKLDRAVRTGWYLLKHARVRISSLTHVRHDTNERRGRDYDGQRRPSRQPADPSS